MTKPESPYRGPRPTRGAPSREGRVPWLAAVLSLLVPGLGQFYNGQPVRGLVIYIGLFAFVAIAGRGHLLGTLAGLIAFAVIAVALRGYVVIDAVVGARRNQRKARYTPPRYNRWYVYVGALLIFGLAVPFPSSLWRIRGYKIPTGSMEETIQIDDRILVDLDAYRNRDPERADIVAYRYPEEPSRQFLHRVVGLPGDRLEIENKQVYVNGLPLEEPYAAFTPPEEDSGFADEERDELAEIELPAGHYFILGDNRDNAHDSRFWGPLPRELIIGQAMIVYWSPDSSRIGTKLKP